MSGEQQEGGAVPRVPAAPPGVCGAEAACSAPARAGGSHVEHDGNCSSPPGPERVWWDAFFTYAAQKLDAAQRQSVPIYPGTAKVIFI